VVDTFHASEIKTKNLATMNVGGPSSNWNPWSSLVSSHKDQNEEYTLLIHRPEEEILPEPDTFEIVAGQEQEPLSSPMSHLSTKTWIEQQQELVTKGELQPPAEIYENDDSESVPEPQEEITLFQGFRAITPRSSTMFTRKVDKPEPVKVVPPEIRRDSIASASVGSITSKMSRVPPKARHQAIAINNIAKLFTELLNEREKLFAESEELEGKRVFLFDVACG
jgi:hypothetical protein